MPRRFELKQGKSEKFWEISQRGKSHTVKYGRIGSAGQTSKKTYATSAEARSSADKLIAQKVGKGYVETAPSKQTATKKSAGRPPRKKAAKLQRASWPAVLNKIKRQPGSRRSIPNNDDLDQFQGVMTFELPKSYRQFMTKFGAGQLSGWCDFWTPAAGDRMSDIFYWNLNHKKLLIDFYDGTDPRARRMVLFGTLFSGDQFGWDPDEVTRSRPRECAIYTVSRHLDHTTRIAETFPELISDFCLGEGLLDYCFPDDRDSFQHVRTEFVPPRP